MADDNKPTPEQIEAANKAEEARWQGDFNEEDLTIPYKRENEDDKTESKSTTTGTDGGDNRQTTEDGKTTTTNDDDDEDTTTSFGEPEPLVTIQDPGDFQPADHSFEITLKDGKTVKVTSPEEADKLADDPENFETPRQLSEFLRKQMKMERGIEADRQEWEDQKSKFTEQVEAETARRESIDTIASEMSYLVTKGMMPKVDNKYLNADWTDPEIAKQDGVREQIDLLNYMAKENEARAKAKIKPLTSIIDAYNAWKLDAKTQEDEARRKKEAEDHKAAGEARKQAGARVAGVSSAGQATYVPKGIAVGRTDIFKRGGASQWED